MRFPEVINVQFRTEESQKMRSRPGFRRLKEQQRFCSMKTAPGLFNALLIGGLLYIPSFPVSAPAAPPNYTVLGWNNLGMHCMDADYAAFSILPPYNTVNAQLIDPNGRLVTNVAGLTLTYQAVTDPLGSINTTSAAKTNFWQFTLPLFGLSLPVDVGLPVPGPNSFTMPGTSNVPQPMNFEPATQWFAAYGIPITPYDDTFRKNPYPMMRLIARSGTTVVGTLDVVLPVSDEMDCRACHGSGSGDAAKPAAGWVNNADPQLDYRLNILRLHDEKQATDPAYQAALATNHYDPNGLYATAAGGTHPVLCASCHLSEALPGSGLIGIKPLTQSVHSKHATVIDPTNGLTLDASANRSACYRCHPGSETRCLRGAMGSAVAADGTMAMQCQSCHGSMTAVGAATRTGWLDEPNCQGCHSGTATSNSGQIRFNSVFDSPGHMRVPANATFATNPNAPGPGKSLFRFSRGHGGLYCEACHGSTHAEFPSSHGNDNVQSIQLQGHIGVLVECDSCHVGQPNTVSGGPHGMHPLGQTWISRHSDVVESAGAAQCQGCHGADYRGTELSRSQADRTLNAFGTKNFWRGFQIGCYTCHNGPGSENSNPNRPPVVTDVTVFTSSNIPLAIPLSATDPDRNPLTLRIVSQATHGTVGLAGSAATYYPESGYVGGDTFTYAAWDGQTNSNLGMIQVNVGSSGCSYTLDSTNATFEALGGTGTVSVKVAANCAWTAVSNTGWITINSGANGSGNGPVKYAVASNNSSSTRVGTLTIAGHTFNLTQNGSTLDVIGAWASLSQVCKTKRTTTTCTLKGQFIVQNPSSLDIPKSSLAVYLSNDNALDGGDVLLRQYAVKKIKSGRSVKVAVSIKLPPNTSASGKFIIGLADADDTLPDVDDANNAVPFGPLP